MTNKHLPTPIKHLVFDMGGVLVQIDWHGQMSKLLGEDIPFEQMHQRWADSEASTAFEENKIDFSTFCEKLIEENGLTISKEQVEVAFRNIVQDDFPDTCEMLEQLRSKYTLSLLSNTNAYHWEMLTKRNTFLPLLHNPFTSLDFGVMKPDPLIYEKLIEKLNCQPEEILFFDDGLMNVEAARKLGINAERVFSPADIKQVLPNYGIELD